MIKIERAVLKVMGWLLALLIFVMVSDIFAAVLVRYVFHTTLNFAEELGRYVFVWIVFIGMARCVAVDKHVALDLLEHILQGKPKKIAKIVVCSISLIFFAAMTYGGALLCEIGARQKSATLRLPMDLVYSCIPICGALSFIFLAVKIVRLIKNREEERPA